ncbi:MAG: GDSL-type esterase/lipase family protein [Kiritimatiellaeota bacterium]|nr:GDSL-type esterase/lipase family protein [Kiritimatiellota bacterium]
MKKLLILAMTSSIASSVSTAQDAAKPTLKLAVIGDSITQGGGPGEGEMELSFRYPLWKNFVDAEMDVEMVGTVTQGFVRQPDYPDYKGKVFDRRCEGYWGWPLTNPGNEETSLNHKIKENLTGKHFDMAILEGGWNDLGQPGFKKENFADDAAHQKACVEGVVERVFTTLETLHAINPKAVVYYPMLPASWEPQTSINAAVKQKINERPADAPPVVFVDIPGWVNKPDEPDTCTLDWVHTNERGDKIFADALFAAMKERLEKFYSAGN